jgi:hypothetical protein
MTPKPLDVADYAADLLSQFADMARAHELARLERALDEAALEAALEGVRLRAEAEGRPYALAAGFAATPPG